MVLTLGTYCLPSCDWFQAPELWFEFLVALLINKDAEAELLKLNPFLSPEKARTVVQMTAATLLVVNRTGATARCIATAHDLAKLLADLKRNNNTNDEGMYNALVLKAASMAELLCATHHYASWNAQYGGVEYDPRFLLFEFTTNFVLRAPQVCAPSN